MQSLHTRIESFELRQVCCEQHTISYRDTTATHQMSSPKSQSQETIVLLHGIGSGSISWLYQLEELSSRYRVVAWDTPGYGESAPLSIGEPDASDYMGALLELLNGLKVGQCYLVGHSLGAIIASRFAKNYPERVQGLVLANPASGYGAQTEEKRLSVKQTRKQMVSTLGIPGLAKQRSRRLLSADASSEAKELVYHNMSRLNRQGYLQAVHLLAYADLAKDVATLAMPIEVYCGELDTITPPTSARAVARSSNQARYYQIDDAGHASYIDQPTEFNSRLVQFIERIKLSVEELDLGKPAC